MCVFPSTPVQVEDFVATDVSDHFPLVQSAHNENAMRAHTDKGVG